MKRSHSFQKQATKEVPSKPVDILSEAAMRNAYYTCHNVQVQCNTRSEGTGQATETDEFSEKIMLQILDLYIVFFDVFRNNFAS